MYYIALVGISVSFILAGIGAFFAYKCWRLWRRSSVSSISIEVTRDRSFLSNNFKLVLIIGGLAALHVFFEMVEYFGLLPQSSFILNVFSIVYFLDLIATMGILLILAILWYRLLLKVSVWDRRWIKPG